MAWNRRRRFGSGARRSTKPAIKEEQKPCVYKNQKCCGCHLHITLGEVALRFQLAKRFRVPCTHCTAQPRRSQWYHVQCRPLDINKAMGYNPNPGQPPPWAPQPATPPPSPGWHPPPVAKTVPPPPKPKTAIELKVESLVAFEAALAAGMRDRSVQKTPELNAALEKLNLIKARILRPSTEGEQDAATNVALKRIIDLVFAR